MKKIFALLCIFSILLLSSCSTKKEEIKKIKTLEFTIVEEENIPEELNRIIDEKKQQAFKLSYSDKDYLYIVVGYGNQETSGYSIAVDELYLAENAIYINTNLIGPVKDEPVSQTQTYPYVVVKTEYLDKSVVFD